MNKRIRELAEKQGLTGPNYLISSQELEKFAELIIEKCVEMVYNHPTLFSNPNYKLDDLQLEIKEYFGKPCE